MIQNSFADLIILTRKELMRKNLNKCVEIAEKNGLYNMSLNQISEKIKAVINNAKTNY